MRISGKQKWAFPRSPRMARIGSGNLGGQVPTPIPAMPALCGSRSRSNPELARPMLPVEGTHTDDYYGGPTSCGSHRSPIFSRLRRYRNGQTHLAPPMITHHKRPLELRSAIGRHLGVTERVDGQKGESARASLPSKAILSRCPHSCTGTAGVAVKRALPGERRAPAGKRGQTQPNRPKPAPMSYQGYVRRTTLIDFTPELRAEAIQDCAADRMGPLVHPALEIKPGVAQSTW